MGSWSVYCGISQIAITAGRPCVLLPLKPAPKYGTSYLPYLPATLPIFGEYDDYGGIENIQKDANTKLIEKHFKISIDKFCYFFTRGIIAQDEDEFPKKLLKNKELKNWKFMFIDREVYEFMATNVNDWKQGCLDLGTPEMLTLMGAVDKGKNTSKATYDPQRFNEAWEIGGKVFYSDGRTLHGAAKHHSFIWRLYSRPSDPNDVHALDYHITVPEAVAHLRNTAQWQAIQEMDLNRFKSELGWILGLKDIDIDLPHDMSSLYADAVAKGRIKQEDADEMLKWNTERMVARKAAALALQYIDDKATFGQSISELVTIRHNLYPMSGYFAPYVSYLTPQFGEHQEHQKILDKFAEINRSQIEPEEDE